MEDQNIYPLVYVNYPHGETWQAHGKDFESMDELMRCVNDVHPDYSSYEIIVVRRSITKK